ncbi:MAG TPA: hypothetical protein PKH07_12865, partial [bacterium]|nr:hypothetical protein [bacterium]
MKGVFFEDDHVEQFDAILQALVGKGLASIQDISGLLDDLDLSVAQDGRDAVRVLLRSLKRFDLPEFGTFSFANRQKFTTFLEDATAFFSYTSFREERNREKAVKAIGEYVQLNPPGELFDPVDRRPFVSDEQFIEAIKSYVETRDRSIRDNLLDSDFVAVRKIVNFRAPRDTKPAKETVRKLSGGPVEVVLEGLWATLADFKKLAYERGVYAHEVLREISIESRLFKHDCDGSSPEERRERARAYLLRLIGGVDQYITKGIDSAFGDKDKVSVKSQLLHDGIECQPARTGEPCLQFSIAIVGEGFDESVVKTFSWRLPDIHPFRVAEELIQWAAEVISNVENPCLPAFHAPYYEELLLAKDDEETRRVLLQCIHDESDGLSNLLEADGVDRKDPLLRHLEALACEYDQFIQKAKSHGIHEALQSNWVLLRMKYEEACKAYLSDPSCGSSHLAAMIFRAFMIITRRPGDSKHWMWESYERSGVVTVLHPALLEMLEAHTLYLLSAFAAIAKRELHSPSTRSFREAVWQSHVDLAAIQMPLSGLIKDSNHILETDVRGDGLLHRIGSVSHSDATLTTRLLLRYDAFDDDDISDSELFRTTGESKVITRILKDYYELHPHAFDGISIAVYQNRDIQPIIAAVDEYLKYVCQERKPGI